MTDLLAVFLLINGLAFWKGENYIILWLLCFFTDVVWGLFYAAEATSQYTAEWVIGVCAVILGFYCLYHFGMVLTNRHKKNR